MPAKRKTNRAAPLGRRKPSSTKSSRSKPARAKSSSKPARKDLHCPIVGIGGSAGGFEATMELLRHLPARDEMTFVVVQHLDPHPSRKLGSLFSRAAPIAVIENAKNTKPKT